MMRVLAAAAVLLAVVGTGAEAWQGAWLADGGSGAIDARGMERISFEGLGGVLSVLLGRASGLDALSVEAHEVAKAVTLDAAVGGAVPRAVFGLQVLGAGPGVFDGIDVEGRALEMDRLDATRAALGLSRASQGAARISVDMGLLKRCTGSCLTDLVAETAARVPGLAYAADSATLGLPNDAQLDTDRPATQLLLAEIAALVAGADRAAARRPERPAVLRGTLVSLQAIRADPEVTAEQAAGAQAALSAAIGAALRAADPAAAVLVATDAAPDVGADTGALLRWRRAAQGDADDDDDGGGGKGKKEEGLTADEWVKRAIAYGAFVLVLYGLYASVYHMVYMPITRDTLLYSRTKAT
ncbi:unnamed protein product [Pedinophyceae sp. YPF-701]|nr:unnamed protein product [Pedinophyceae sp. YPF-701]